MSSASFCVCPIVLAIVLLARAPFAVGQQSSLEVRFVPPAPEIGDIVRVEVTGPHSLQAVDVGAGSGHVVMRPGGSPGLWVGLLGIDIDVRPGPIRVVVSAFTASDERLTASATLDVRARTFSQRRLRFPPKMANPSAEDLARARAETARLEGIFKNDSVPMWQSPFVRPVPGRITSTFGTRTIVNGQRRGRHIGVDLAGPVGTPIVAPNAGRVVLADDLFYTGNTVVVDHGGGLFSFFGHLSRVDVTPDQSVEAGDIVGAVGATGRVTGPHLHWSMRLNGARVDPLRILDLGPE